MIIDIKNDKYLPSGRYVLWTPEKIERAKNTLPMASDHDILIEYDKIGGLVVRNGIKLPPQSLWQQEQQKMQDPMENLTDDELDTIQRKAENTHITGSRYQKAKIESEIRHRKKMEKLTQEPKISIGILNRGKNNKFINNTFEGLDVGIQDEGESTLAVGNKFTNFGKNVEKFHAKHPWWFALITGGIFLIVGYLLELAIRF
ncbi:MAG: hypothetical protein Q8L01_02350 [Candidatus Woesebacteria bacterium]|nr:hypothetical protein [Candidatus Woesebacteria bacterium]